MTAPDVPFEKFIELSSLSEAGMEIVIAPNEAERAQIAEWAEVTSIPSFRAAITLKRNTPSRFSYEADLRAEVVQPCVVTLEPVTQIIEQKFTRQLHLTHAARRRPELVELSPGAGEDESPEEIESTRYNVAGPVLEEFSLAIDPYPRAPGVAYEPPPEEKPESPFAVLKQLQRKS
ncbi:MAG TPA: YceD family protein [Rhizomicrobium sp.]|nr:YceD family protein [Rhizomicrobium sp.]